MEPDPINVSDSTAVTIPIRNLIAIGVGLTLFTAQFFVITSRLDTLEEDNRRHTEEIEAAKTFRYQWSRGELGLIGIDIEQNIRLDHIEHDISTFRALLQRHVDKEDEHN